MSKLKNAFHKGPGIDDEIDSAFSRSPAPSPAVKSSFSERVLESQQKFAGQFQKQSSQSKPAPAAMPKTDRSDFGRFDPDFAPARHLDDFDETKNFENFKNQEIQLPPPQPRLTPSPQQKQGAQISAPGTAASRDDLMELATATPRRNMSLSGDSRDSERILEELEDVKAQNSEILRRIQRIEEKMRR